MKLAIKLPSKSQPLAQLVGVSSTKIKIDALRVISNDRPATADALQVRHRRRRQRR